MERLPQCLTLLRYYSMRYFGSQAIWIEHPRDLRDWSEGALAKAHYGFSTLSAIGKYYSALKTRNAFSQRAEDALAQCIWFVQAITQQAPFLEPPNIDVLAKIAQYVAHSTDYKKYKSYYRAKKVPWQVVPLFKTYLKRQYGVAYVD